MPKSWSYRVSPDYQSESVWRVCSFYWTMRPVFSLLADEVCKNGQPTGPELWHDLPSVYNFYCNAELCPEEVQNSLSELVYKFKNISTSLAWMLQRVDLSRSLQTTWPDHPTTGCNIIIYCYINLTLLLLLLLLGRIIPCLCGTVAVNGPPHDAW